MDTTSHNFTWQMFTFGDKLSSKFQDVAIIDDNQIWVGGEIYTNDVYTFDSLGNEIEPYNVLYWDGYKWVLKRIEFYIEATPPDYFPFPVKAIFAFSMDDIWFARGGNLVHWNGNKFVNDYRMNKLLTGGIDNIWGVNSNDLYISGSKGMIMHYNGKDWCPIESGTNLNLDDMWGVETNNEKYILCPAYSLFQSFDKKLLSVKNNTVQEEKWPFDDEAPYTTWFNDKNNIFIAGGEVFVRNRIGMWKELNGLPPKFIHKIRGTDINNIYIAGAYGLFAHYNGRSWKYIMDYSIAYYNSLAVKNDVVIAVGETFDRKAVILMVKLNN
jgi:hypothetical protein